MSSPVDASYLADTVVVLRYFEHAGMVKKAISVLKKRTGAHEESIREIWFESDGIHLSEPLLQLRGVLTGVPVEVTPSAKPELSKSMMLEDRTEDDEQGPHSSHPRDVTAKSPAGFSSDSRSTVGLP